MRVDDPGVRGGERFRTQVPLRRPRELLRVDPRGLAHAGVAEVASVREQRGIAVLVQPRLARSRAVRVRELVAEGGPGIDVDQDVGEIDLRQTAGDVRCERGRRGRPFGAGQPADVQLSVLDVDRHVARRERAIERGSVLVQIAGELLEALVGGRW